MKRLKDFSVTELEAFYKDTEAEYRQLKAKCLKLDMSRGKPSRAQLDLSVEMLSLPGTASTVIDGIETANYGVLDGLPSCKELFADLLDTDPKQVFIGGSASLTLMYDTIAKAFTHGLLHSDMPWSKLATIKFLCPVPGYDRHFKICESFGIEMIPVEMNADGPDMNVVEQLIKDENVRGIWCVPKFSNPSGIVYSEQVINRLASMKPAAKDFIMMWDNAYCVHEFDGEFVQLQDILSLCAKYGNADMVVEFASTSKITFPGAGVSCFACSDANMSYFKKLISAQAISYDKLNQLRHIMFFKNKEGVLLHMRKHASIMKPKFDVVVDSLNSCILPLDIATWNKPYGGYFVSLNCMKGTAKRVHSLCKDAGLNMTEVGATYPYKADANDSNLRIAPSFPPIDELKSAMQLLCVCIKLAAIEVLLHN